MNSFIWATKKSFPVSFLEFMLQITNWESRLKYFEWLYYCTLWTIFSKRMYDINFPAIILFLATSKITFLTETRCLTKILGCYWRQHFSRILFQILLFETPGWRNFKKWCNYLYDFKLVKLHPYTLFGLNST